MTEMCARFYLKNCFKLQFLHKFIDLVMQTISILHTYIIVLKKIIKGFAAEYNLLKHLYETLLILTKVYLEM
jgi:hypothetical protein